MFEKKKNGRPTKRPDLATLSMLYQTMTARQIAELYCVSDSTVRSWVSRARKQQQQEQEQEREQQHIEETIAKVTQNEDKTDENDEIEFDDGITDEDIRYFMQLQREREQSQN